MSGSANLPETLTSLRIVAREVPLLESPYPLEEPTFGPGASEAEIDDLRYYFGTLPEDYATFLRLCRSIMAMDVFIGYELFSPVVAVAVLGTGPRRVIVGPPEAPEEVRFAPVGRNGGGDLFMLGTGQSAERGVWKWLHESGTRFDGLAEASGCVHLADTFVAFLARVNEDWKAFVSDTQGWEYI